MSELQENMRCVLTAIIHELASVETRLNDFNRRPFQIIQFGLLLVGAATLATQLYVEILATVPIFWNVWLLYVFALDRFTMQHVIYAEHLENRANEALASLELSGDGWVDCGVFGLRLARREHSIDLLEIKKWSQNIAHNVLLLVWTVLAISSTSLVCVVLYNQDIMWLFFLLIIYQAVVVIVALWAHITRGKHLDRFRYRLKTTGRTSSTSGG